MCCLSRDESLNLKDDNYWKPINGQTKPSVREFICVVNWRWRTVFTRNAMQEVDRKLKNWGDAAWKAENGVTRQKLNDCSMQQDQESRTVSLLQDQIQKSQDRMEFIEDSKIFQDLDSPSSFGSAHVAHQALIPSSSKWPSREVGMPRNTREDMSIPGSVYDCQPARQVREESYNDSRNLAASSGIQRREGIEKTWEWSTIATNVFILLFFWKSWGKSLDDKLS